MCTFCLNLYMILYYQTIWDSCFNLFMDLLHRRNWDILLQLLECYLLQMHLIFLHRRVCSFFCTFSVILLFRKHKEPLSIYSVLFTSGCVQIYLLFNYFAICTTESVYDYRAPINPFFPILKYAYEVHFFSETISIGLKFLQVIYKKIWLWFNTGVFYSWFE